MRLPSFSRPIIGIQATGGVLRIAILTKHRWKESMNKVCEKEIPSKIVSPDGTIRSPKECGQLIRLHLEQAGLPARGRAVLLLAPEKVYTHLFTLPVMEKEQIENILRLEVAKVIPEEIADLSLNARPLAQTATDIKVGLAAVRSDVLQGYLESAREAGLTVERVTTAPAAIGCFTRAQKDSKNYLLVSLPSGPEKRSTITVFHQGFPIDEAIFPPGLAEQSILQSVNDLLKEYAAKGMPMERLVLWVDPALEERLRQAQTAGGAAGIPELERALPWLKDRNVEWGGIQAACLAPEQKLRVNFLASGSRKRIPPLWIFGGLAGAFGLVILFLVIRMML